MNKFPNQHLLVDSDYLNSRLFDEKVIIIDARTQGYEDGHIPSAVPLNPGNIIDRMHEVEGFIANAEQFESILNKLGVQNDASIIVYDDGQLLNAARIFYALEYYGFYNQVKILAGGINSWVKAGRLLTREITFKTESAMTVKENPLLLTTKQQIAEKQGSTDYVVIDTRSKEEYDGTDKRRNKYGGHIPHAVHLSWTDNLIKNEDGNPALRSYEELKAIYETAGILPHKTAIPYCQTNVRGSNTYFVLRLMGYQDIRPYEGSWSEWGNADDIKIEK
mgnify:FL=1